MEDVRDVVMQDLDGLRVQLKQMTELARLENREETYLYQNMLKLVQEDCDLLLKSFG